MLDESGQLFSAFEVLLPQGNASPSAKLHAYLIESTALDNIDDDKSKILKNSKYTITSIKTS
jgi:hypothetical protein